MYKHSWSLKLFKLREFTTKAHIKITKVQVQGQQKIIQLVKIKLIFYKKVNSNLVTNMKILFTDDLWVLL